MNMATNKPIGTTNGNPMAGSHINDDLDVDTEWHYHDVHVLNYAFEGSIEVESEKGRTLIPKQLVAFVPAGVKHRVSIHRVKSCSVLFDRI